jgi:hypothetical protein
MKQHDFEGRVLSLWTTSRVPLTRANLLAHTKVPRAQMDAWLEEMAKERLIELDTDDEGELVWKVRGSTRPSRGPQSLAELSGSGSGSSSLLNQVDGLAASAGLAARAAGLSLKLKSQGGAAASDRKSLLASGALSFFFGPIGWLYAGPLKEALPAILVYVIVCSIVPKFLLVYLLGPVNVVATIAGVLYAWSYNQSGKRLPLVLKDSPPAELPPPRDR